MVVRIALMSDRLYGCGQNLANEHVNPFGDLLCPVFAVPIVIASLAVLVVAAFV
jgi:hypothetical protein